MDGSYRSPGLWVGTGKKRVLRRRLGFWTFVWGGELAGVFPRCSGFLTFEIFFCFAARKGEMPVA